MTAPITTDFNAFIRREDLSPGHGPASKKIHMISAENEVPVKTQTSRAMATKSATNTRSSLAARSEPGNRDYKAPMGPRPPDFPSSKRVNTDNSTFLGSSNSRANALPSATSEPFLGLSARRATANFDFTIPKGSEENETKKTRNRSLSSSLKRADVASKNSDQAIASHEHALAKSKVDKPFVQKDPPTLAVSNVPAPPAAVAGSLVRRENTALRAALLSTATATASNSQAGASNSTRARRQSQFPLTSAPANPDAHRPRKSIGPGFVMSNAQTSVSDQSSVSNAQDPASPSTPIKTVGSIVRKVSNPRAKPRISMIGSAPKITDPKPRNPSSIVTTAEGTTASPRPTAHIALEPQVSQERPHALHPDIKGDESLSQDRLEESSHLSTPQQATAPLYAVRKQSSAASHAGGLGARTVSPTDIRKQKTLSIAKPPPLPGQPPTPEHTPVSAQGPYSPPPSRHKSTTPTSSQETPEVTVRLSTGRSLSSRSSYSSLRPSSSSQQTRTITGTQPARPTLAKSRNVHSSASGILEAVPPVPAIPKAYESPKEAPDGVDEPFFSAFEDQPSTRGPSSIDSDLSKKSHDAIQSSREPLPETTHRRHKRGFTLGSRAEATKAQQATKGTFRQSQQHMRLPPLSFPPLSDPTAAKLAAISKRPQDVNNSTINTVNRTPPPVRSRAKTPTTPMTASKATFSGQEAQQLHEFDSRRPLRSNTSYGHTRSGTSSRNVSGTCSPANMPTASPAPPRSNLTPFISTSVPKSGSDPKVMTPRDSQPLSARNSQSGLEKLKGKCNEETHLPPAQKDTSSNNSPAQSQNETSGGHNSIRRRLSLSWRKSSASAKNVQTNDGQASESTDMPPPKFPASAHNSGAAVSPAKTPRKQSKREPDLKNGPGDQRASVSHENLLTKSLNERRVHSTQPKSTQPSSRASSSLLSPMHKLLGSRSSSSIPPPQPQAENRVAADALSADEEMRRLASKRKEFEAAAKELTDLNKRALAKERMSPSQASQSVNLNIYERGEIIDYRDVYFCGLKNAKKLVADLNSQPANFGFDDERGDYNIVVGDHLAYRYEVIDLLGKGSFGQVVRCIDHKAGKLVAVKIIRNKKRFHQQALVEVNILAKIREWDPECTHSMINFTQSFYFRGHLCISTELLGLNLYEFIKAHDFRGFSIKLIRRFTQQMLSSLLLLQGRNVIHCDLKPENILLAHPLHSEIKVIDFGSSCFQNEKVYTYIQSRFYRSPEVILGMDYGLPIDMWSLGCILAELHTGYPIFPGENEQEQLACIMEVFGPPEKHLIERSSRKKLFFDSLGKPRVTVSSKGKRRRPSSKTLNQVLKCENEAFVDFIAKCLRWDPDRRLKPNEAIHHEFITGLKPTPPALLTRAQVSAGMGAASPSKRYTMQPAAKARPLPEPPLASSNSNSAMSITAAAKSGIGSVIGTPSSSPVKGIVTPRRHSAMTTVQQQNAGVKRSSNGAAVGSALPRVAPTRTASGKADLASAAAIASLRQK